MTDFFRKPLLYNGFFISPDRKIEKYIETVFFTQIFQLDTGEFLYLFLDITKEDIIKNNVYPNLVEIDIGDSSYLGIVVISHLRNSIYEIKEQLTTLTGLACVGGMEPLKKILYEDVINPLRNPEKFKKFKVSLPNGILLYGPPGCGKTFIIRKLAEELNYNFIEVKHSDLATPFIHGSVNNIGKYFSIAKDKSPSILFFDEISGLLPNRETITSGDSFKEEEVNEFLIQLNDASENRILVVGATNFIERLDKAAIRPGRFDKKIFVDLPDTDAREAIFRLELSQRPYEKTMNFTALAIKSEGLSCADIVEDIIESVSREAANRDLDEINELQIIEKIIQTKNSN